MGVRGKVGWPAQDEVVMSKRAVAFVKKRVPGCLSLLLLPLLCRIVEVVRRTGQKFTVGSSVNDLQLDGPVQECQWLVLYCAARRYFVVECDSRFYVVCGLPKGGLFSLREWR